MLRRVSLLVGAAAAPSAVLAGEVDLRMHDAHVTSEGVVAAESLLLNAQGATHLLFAGVVDRVLMAGQVVGPREDRVARLARRRVDALALVWARLRVARKELG